MSRRKRRRNMTEEDLSSRKKQKTTLNGVWEKKSSILIFKHSDAASSPKIAAFDFDSTLVRTKSGRVFAKDPSDWQIWDRSVKVKFDNLLKRGYKLVIFSNQGGVAKGKLTEEDLKERMNQFVNLVNVPITVMCACGFDKNRKPSVGMWDTLITDYNSALSVDKSSSLYVGDAAGRVGFKSVVTKKKRNDHSCDDRKLASNIGIRFYTPEEFFLDEPPYKNWNWKGLDVVGMKSQLTSLATVPSGFYDRRDRRNEVIVFVGVPACGKSSFFKREFSKKKYVRVNLDTMKTHPKCVREMKAALDAGKSVVVDNTNPDVKSRNRYTSVAKSYGVPMRCFQFTTNYQMAWHMNMYREVVDGVKHVPTVAYNMYKKKFQEPNASREGFEEVIKIPFVPTFSDKKREEMFYKYY